MKTKFEKLGKLFQGLCTLGIVGSVYGAMQLVMAGAIINSLGYLSIIGGPIVLAAGIAGCVVCGVNAIKEKKAQKSTYVVENMKENENELQNSNVKENVHTNENTNINSNQKDSGIEL